MSERNQYSVSLNSAVCKEITKKLFTTGIVFITSISLISSLFTSCARYHAQPLTRQYLKQDRVASQPVVVNVKKFSSEDSIHFLGRDVIQKGFQPIQITVNNNSDRFLIFAKDGVELTTATPEEVAKSVETSTVGRATGYGIAALIIWPFLIPAIVDGVKSAKANDQLMRDYLNKTIDRLEILPHTTVTGVVFVPVKQMKDDFAITMIDRDTAEKLSFSIQLR